MSATEINDLMQIWGARHAADGPPFDSKQHLYDTIDSASFGDIPWQSFSVQYNGDSGDDLNDSASWKRKEFIVHYHDARKVLHSQLQNPDFANEIDYGPIQVFDEAGKCRYCNFMSGNWANCQADIISEDPRTHGSAFCPVILGSDKTTVSVATGHTEYYPVYISNGMIHNNVRRAHRNADAEHRDSDEFRQFRRSLFHGALAVILESLRAAMKDPEVVRFGDGHYRRVIYGIGPYMADYPEQVLLACIVQGVQLGLTISMVQEADDLTSILWRFLMFWGKHRFGMTMGTFKDHLVTWINEYLELEHTKAEATRIIADIDRRIAAVSPFPGLRRFPEGRGFKQWTGDNSKALMKVYLPAIAGHVPFEIVQCLKHFMEFCYLVRRSVLDENNLMAIDNAIANFHHARQIFQDVSVRPDGISLPRQHSIVHYRFLIQEFGAPNGLCSSITESAHIKAVKEPWRRSNRYEALGQMLTINQRLSKLAACRVSFRSRGMLRESIFGDDLQPEPPAGTMNGDDDDGGAVDGKDIWGEVVLSQKP
ncbi:hypothetical protein H0H92_007560, partial [Tricholoma furcatifolium]